MRKDCSPICDGAAALVILTSKPQAVRIAGLGSATQTSSVLDRDAPHAPRGDAHRVPKIAPTGARGSAIRGTSFRLWSSRPTTHSTACCRSGSSDLGFVDADDADRGARRRSPAGSDPPDPLLITRSPARADRVPTNLSGGLKARGHPVGGTGLFQIAETYLQLTGEFPNPRAQVDGASMGLCHSIGGPGNNVYVTLLERSDSGRKRDEVARPETHHAVRENVSRSADGPAVAGRAVVEAATTIHVTAPGVPAPVHVALLSIGGRRVFAKLEHAAGEDDRPEQVLAGQRVELLVKDDGDHYFQIPRPWSLGGFDVGRIVDAIRRRVGA